MQEWLVAGTIYGVYFGFVIVVIFGWILYEHRLMLRSRGFAAELGKVVLDRSSVRWGAQLVIRPMDSRLERVELSQFLVNRRQRWRMLVDLVEDSDYAFEMWSKVAAGVGRVFVAGEGVIGVEDVDRGFWTETTAPKRVAALLGDPEVHRLFAVAANRGLRFLRVGGNRIQLEFDRGADHARAMFDLAHLLSHRMLEFG